MKILQGRSSKAKILNSGLLVFLAVLMVYVYEQFLFPTNSYLGVKSLFSEGSTKYFLSLAVGLFFVATLFPKDWKSPSDAFLSIYILFVCIPSLILFPIYGNASIYIYLFNLFPVLIVIALRYLSTKTRVVSSIRLANLNTNSLAVFLILISAFIIIYAANQGALSLSFEDLSNRRLTAREVFRPGALTSYVLQATMNMVAPLLAFIYFRKGTFLYCLIPIGLSLFFFSLTGVKSVFVVVIFSALLGYLVRVGRVASAPRIMLNAYLMLFLLAASEFYFSGYTFVGDFGINRLFMKNALIQQFYFDILLYSNDLFSGHANITYFVGEQYFNNSLTNANTNGFLTTLVGKGLLAYVTELIALMGLILVSDLMYKQDKNTLWILLMSVMSFLLAEQTLSVALGSSGMLVGFGLVFLMSKQKTVNLR